MAAKVEGEVERVQEVGGKGRGRGSLLVNLAAKRAKVEEEDVEEGGVEEGAGRGRGVCGVGGGGEIPGPRECEGGVREWQRNHKKKCKCK